jgi:signal transduction histidine kinase
MNSHAQSRVENILKHMPIGVALFDAQNSRLLVGIAANELPYIFERFHRASNFDRSISGLDIGLYLVNELVTSHGGRVWVESMEGQGSTFYVSLPLNNTDTHVSNLRQTSKVHS